MLPRSPCDTSHWACAAARTSRQPLSRLQLATARLCSGLLASGCLCLLWSRDSRGRCAGPTRLSKPPRLASKLLASLSSWKYGLRLASLPTRGTSLLRFWHVLEGRGLPLEISRGWALDSGSRAAFSGCGSYRKTESSSRSPSTCLGDEPSLSRPFVLEVRVNRAQKFSRTPFKGPDSHRRG